MLVLSLATALAAALAQAPAPAAALPRARAIWVDPASLVIDGDAGEWRGSLAPDVAPAVVIERLEQFVELDGRPARELWSGPEDASLRMWVGWNEEDLVLGGEVYDEVEDHDAARWFQGDSLELFLNTKTREPRWGPDDFQMMLAPDWPDRPWGVYPHEGQSAGNPRTSDGGFGGVEVASAPFVGGYRFEARIPWRNFGGYAPRGGAEIPFNFALGDRDGRGRQESYGTWTGERDIATSADRRGTLVLEAGARDLAAAGSESASGPSLGMRSLLLLALAALYGIALATRRMWRSKRARRAGLIGAAALGLVSGGLALAARWAKQSEGEVRRAAAEGYWSRFEELLASGALGHPEPARLVESAQALLNDKGIAPVVQATFQSLAAEGYRLEPGARTARRGIPYDVLVPVSPPDAPPPSTPPSAGIVLSPGESYVFPLAEPALVDAVQLVTRVSDRRFLRTGEQIPVLSIEVRRGGELAIPAREVRHRQDLHHEEDEHVDHPGLEPALYAPGGRLGNVHGDGLLLEFDRAHEIDEVVVRHVGPEPGYQVLLLAVGVRRPGSVPPPPPGMRATSSGEWRWSEWSSSLEAEVTTLGRSPKKTAIGQIVRPLKLGQDPVAMVHVRDVTPGRRATRWDFLPIGVLAGLAPFLVALFAESLATQRRIRGKLGVGFAVSSAVPLLALTLLLEASLEAEHETNETERAQAALVRAEQDLEREQRELEHEAQRLLRIAELGRRLDERFPETSDELAAWWGEGEGALRLLERTAPDGRKLRVGTGPMWRELPRGQLLRSGLVRPWGELLLFGVAQTASGAEQPLTVLIARAPKLPGASVAAVRGAGALEPGSQAGSVRLIGAGRDPAPSFADLAPRSPREIRRPVFGPQGDDLVGVLVVSRRERGVPLLGDYTLTELLLAAGITAVFTALLFAGILTGHIVGPIERLDRAVREGRSSAVVPEVQDEIGHLTSAIQSFTSEVAHRVSQLETLQVAQEELSSKLDPEPAREAVLEFFAQQSSARSAWLVWCGEVGEEPRIFGQGGRNLPVVEREGFFQRALSAGQVVHSEAGELARLAPGERLLLGQVERVLALPLLAGGECRGAIVLGFAPGGEPADLAFLRAAAAQAAIVLENARLYQQAVVDAVTGFLSDPGFRQRVTEEIQRAEGQPDAGVLLVQIRLTGLPEDDARAAARLREAAKRMRLAARGLAVFGRSGSADLKVAIPWSERPPQFEAIERRLVDRVAAGPWPDGESVVGVLSSHAAWPTDGPSGRFVMSLLEERLGELHSGVPAPSLAAIRERLPPDFVAGAQVMAQLLETVRRMAEEEVTVLISGETGVGKDRIAELVHEWSPRRGGPLVHIHCPSLTGTLIEDELFGHEKGAFTGAHTRRIGPFEYAAGGTVVLDEVGGLSPEGQVALLRLLETREVLPLGATKPVSLNVRIVATTSRDLAAEVERGRFRGDLYFRLNVAQIPVPPLRLRRQALPELVGAFVKRFNASAARPVTGVSPKVLDVLFDHDWPGNVRELENVLSRGLILAAGTELQPEHIGFGAEGYAIGLDSASERLLNQRQERLLDDLAEEGQISSTEYADREGISARTGLRDLLELVESGYLAREGQRRGTRFRRTRRPRGARAGQ